MKTQTLMLALAGTVVLVGCSEPEVILPGLREDPRAILQGDQAEISSASVVAENQSLRIALPRQSSNANWAQSHGSPANRTAHPALASAPNLAWAASIGTGHTRRSQITATPVVADGRVFTMDSQSVVSAVSTSGAVLWSRDLTPPRESAGEAGGGGMAVAGGRLYITSGYGRVLALDTETGAEIWVQNLRAVGTGAPTIDRGLVYLTAGDSASWALEQDTGRIRWQLGGLPDANNVSGGPAPALTDKFAIFASGAGDVRAVFRKGGLTRWTSAISGRRPGYAVNTVDDITGAPVVQGDRVFASNHTGRLVAIGVESGKREWTARDAALGPVWPAGGSVFFVSDRHQLIRVDAATGDRIWAVDLPGFVKQHPRRSGRIYAHFGPVLAGGQVITASDDGQLRFFDPVSGDLTRSVEIPGGAATAPVVAGGTLYLVSGKGEVLAFR